MTIAKTAVPASECTRMDDVRTAIDLLDREIVPLLLKRLGYIEAAARIKPKRDQVRDPARIKDVLNKAGATARDQGGDEAFIRKIYAFLIESSIEHEFGAWDTRASGASGGRTG